MSVTGLRPLSVGEALDVALKLYRRGFADLVRLVAVVVVPVQVLAAVIRVSTTPDNGQRLIQTQTDFDGRTHVVVTSGFWTAMAGSLVVLLLSGMGSSLAAASCLRAVSTRYLAQDSRWQDSLRFVWNRFPSVLWVTFLAWVLAALALLLLVVPGVYLWLCWLVALPVVLLEDRRGRGALKRSRQLVRGRWWPTFGTYLLAILLAAIVQSVLTGVLSALVLAGHPSRGASILINAVAAVISALLVTPFTASVITVIYFDLRVRHEGYDLELLARGVGVPPTGARPVFLPPPPAEAPGDQPPFWPPPPGWTPLPDEGRSDWPRI